GDRCHRGRVLSNPRVRPLTGGGRSAPPSPTKEEHTMNNSIPLQKRDENEQLNPEPLSGYEESQRYGKFLENLRSGTASLSDLDGCTGKVNLMQRQLLRFADELHELHVAGIEYRLRHPVDWAARVLHVPAGEPVPSFILDPLERVFERAWVQTPQEFPSKMVDYG